MVCSVHRFSGNAFLLRQRSCVPILMAALAFATLIALTPNSRVFAADAVLSWDANTESDLAGYHVHYGTTSRTYTAAIPVGTATSYTVTGLGPGTYYFAVTADNTSSGRSDYSNEATKIIPDTTAPVISAVAASSVTASGVTVTWTTNEPATSLVEYGLTTGYGTSSALNSTRVTSHSRPLVGLSSATTYHYRVISVDATGNSAVSADYTFTTAQAGDTTPPVLSSIAAGAVTSSGATVTWTTNEVSTTQVDYGTTASYGASTTLNSSLVTAHSAALAGLQGATTYHFRVRSADAAGNVALSGDAAFTTAAAPDTTAPALSAIASGSLTSAGATITWTTNEAATTQVDYGTTTAYGTSTTLNSSLVTTHSAALASLQAATTYHFRVRSADAASNSAVSGDATFVTLTAPDTAAPVISGVVASSTGATSTVITWSTNEASTSVVEYGLGTGYGSSSSNPTLVSSHSVSLTGLAPSTTYHFRVGSVDSSGNSASSADSVFSTSAQPDTTPPVLSSIAAGGVTSNGATVTWTTNEAATTQVDYGTTTAYGSSTALNSALLTAHSAALAGLQGATTYHFRARSLDAAGNVALSGDATFTTAPALDTTAPALSAIASGSLTSNSATVTWTTNEASTTQVDYGTTTSYGASTTLNASLLAAHNAALAGLQAATTYHFRVRSADAAGNVAVSGDRTFATAASPDTTGPTISSVGASNLTQTSTAITWSTNEPATSRVEYGLTTAYGQQSPASATLMTSHRQTLTGLTAGATYHYRVQSADAAGNVSRSNDFTVSLPSTPDTTPPQDIRSFSGNGAPRQIRLRWTNPSDSDFAGVQIRFRLDRFPTSPTDGDLLGDFSGQPGEAGEALHDSLIDGVTYYYAGASYDFSGNRQNTVFASATAGEGQTSVDEDLSSQTAGCGMIIPRDGGPPSGPWQAADLLVMAAVALYCIRRRLIRWPAMGAVTSPG